MGRAIEVHFCLQRHNCPHFSVCIMLSMHYRLLSAVFVAHASATTNLQPFWAAAQGAEILAQTLCAPRRVLWQVLFFLSGLACESLQNVVVNWSQNKYLIVPELTEYLSNVCLLNIMVRFNFFWGWRLDNFLKAG